MSGRNFKAIGMALAMLTAVTTAQAETAKWLRAESPHFVLYSDNSEKTTRSYLERLEQYRYLLTRSHGQTEEDDADTPRLSVYFLGSHRDLQQTWPKVKDDVLGYFKDCSEGQAAFAVYQDDISAARSSKVQYQDENLSQIVLFHEYAHTFMFQSSTAKYPLWFVEGFAEFYSTIKFQGDQAVIGMEARMRAGTLAWAGGLPYDKLLRGDKNLRADNTVDAFYAQSWLLTHYIMSSPERKKAFEAYLVAYDAGQDPVVAFETAFGIKVKDLDHILDSYHNKLMATLYRIKDMPAPQITVSPMPVSANKLLLWDSAVRICPAKDDRPTFLTNISTEAAKYPADDFAQMTLARAEIIIGDESKALDYLLKYTADHPDDAEGRYRLGQTWFLMTVHNHIVSGETQASQIAKAKSALGLAYKLDPLNAANLYYYSMALADRGEPSDNSLNAAIAAHSLAPSVDEYAVRAATLLIRKDRADEAAGMLYPLANNPHNEAEARWASNIITAIQAKATREDLLKLLRTPIRETISPDKPAAQ